MKLGRRGALLGLAAVGAGAAGAVGFRAGGHLHGSDRPRRLEVVAGQIPAFRKGGSTEERRFGDLLFRSGLVLTSSDDAFGGISGWWRSPDGGRFVGVTDQAQWLTGSVNYAGGRLAGLAEVAVSPILGEDGRPLRRSRSYDTEALAMADGIAYVGIERVHEVRRFEWARDGVAARGIRIEVPAEAARAPDNASIEAVAVAPAGHPLAGAVLAVAENARPRASAPTRGWVLTGPARFGFDVARSDDFDITDAAFLGTGELLLLERRYSRQRGVACRMRRVAPDAIREGPTINGPVIFEVDDRFEIDNMEAVALHRDETGETVLTLLSDDNFSPAQRTLMLEFALRPER